MTMSHNGFGPCAHATLAETQDAGLPDIPVLSTGTYCFSRYDNGVRFGLADLGVQHHSLQWRRVQLHVPVHGLLATVRVFRGLVVHQRDAGIGRDEVRAGLVQRQRRDVGQQLYRDRIGHGQRSAVHLRIRRRAWLQLPRDQLQPTPVPFTYTQTAPSDQRFLLGYSLFGKTFEEYIFMTIPT